MPTPDQAPSELRTICLTWSKTLDAISSQSDRINFFEGALPELLLDDIRVRELLYGISQGKNRPDRRHTMMFANEFLLYMDARRRFSLRMYLHEPGEYTSIHDHSSWGVLGNASGTMEIIKYRRMDEGRQEGYARVEESSRFTCKPGHTDRTLPLNEGIHCVGNPTAKTIAIINVYGSPIRRLFINRFDVENNRVDKVFPLHLRKMRLAAKALEAFETGN
jgi:predicted metal-dependent enzyme (double-stranded beta helix superfamily)